MGLKGRKFVRAMPIISVYGRVGRGMVQPLNASPATLPSVKRTFAPICVDLDGTLVCTDTLWECLIASWRKNPWLMLLFPVWLLRGRAYLKQEAAKHANLDVGGLPYDTELVHWLAEQHASGRIVMLVTGESAIILTPDCKHLGY